MGERRTDPEDESGATEGLKLKLKLKVMFRDPIQPPNGGSHTRMPEGEIDIGMLDGPDGATMMVATVTSVTGLTRYYPFHMVASFWYE